MIKLICSDLCPKKGILVREKPRKACKATWCVANSQREWVWGGCVWVESFKMSGNYPGKGWQRAWGLECTPWYEGLCGAGVAESRMEQLEAGEPAERYSGLGRSFWWPFTGQILFPCNECIIVPEMETVIAKVILYGFIYGVKNAFFLRTTGE